MGSLKSLGFFNEVQLRVKHTFLKLLCTLFSLWLSVHFSYNYIRILLQSLPYNNIKLYLNQSKHSSCDNIPETGHILVVYDLYILRLKTKPEISKSCPIKLDACLWKHYLLYITQDQVLKILRVFKVFNFGIIKLYSLAPE